MQIICYSNKKLITQKDMNSYSRMTKSRKRKDGEK